jgi:4-oxalocrotonate tautomerase
MPIVKIDMWTGRTDEQKEKLIKGVTQAFVDIDIPKEHVHIVINENPPKNWGIRGEVGSKLDK